MIQSRLGRISVGEGQNVRVIGVINLSPESFYPESVKRSVDEAVNEAGKMIEEGVDIIDVGGMSTAPYKETYVSCEVELSRVVPVVRALKRNLDVCISIDTQRSRVAEEAVKSGAEVINDVTGLKADDKMAGIIAEYDVSAIIMAREVKPLRGAPIERIRGALRESLEICFRSGVDGGKIVVDPGIGFFRHTEWKWYEWDTYVLRNLRRLLTLRKPICVGVSRKSFIGEILGQKDPRERLIGSLASEAIAVLNGAHVIRTHDVAEAIQAIRIAEKIRGERKILKVNDVSAEDLTEIWERSDLGEVMRMIGVDEGGIEIMADKGIFKLILIKKIPRILATVLKQEMLACGGEVATPRETILGGGGSVDVLLMGNVKQLKKLVGKLRNMSFSYLRRRKLPDAQDLAEMISNFLPNS